MYNVAFYFKKQMRFYKSGNKEGLDDINELFPISNCCYLDLKAGYGETFF